MLYFILKNCPGFFSFTNKLYSIRSSFVFWTVFEWDCFVYELLWESLTHPSAVSAFPEHVGAFSWAFLSFNFCRWKFYWPWNVERRLHEEIIFYINNKSFRLFFFFSFFFFFSRGQVLFACLTSDPFGNHRTGYCKHFLWVSWGEMWFKQGLKLSQFSSFSDR